MGLLTQLKDYLADRPETAIAALLIFAVIYLHRLYVKERDKHLETLKTMVPLADKLCRLIGRIGPFLDRWERD
jgi:hypothetical protein